MSHMDIVTDVEEKLVELLEQKGLYQKMQLQSAVAWDKLQACRRTGRLIEGKVAFQPRPIHNYCPNCDASTTFSHSGEENYGEGRLVSGGTTYTLSYSCAYCSFKLAVMIFGTGSQLQLVGRTHKRRINTASWPQDIAEIISKALEADSEGDTQAGFYHIRTALEFYMKSAVKLARNHKIDGTTLCELYHKALPIEIRERFGITKMYAEASESMHVWSNNSGRLNKMIGDLHKHCDAVELFKQDEEPVS